MKLYIVSLLSLFALAVLAEQPEGRNLALDTTACVETVDCCVGKDACRDGAGTVKTGSCDGKQACRYSAYEATGSFSVVENSCKGPYACYQAGRAGIATVGTGSCIAEDPNDDKVKNACTSAGRYGNFAVAESSCHGTYACQSSASGKSAAKAGGKSVIQKDACIGKQACQNTAYDATGRFLAEDNSCKGPYACYHTGRAGSATVGTGSCIAEDPNDAKIKNACSYAGRDGNFAVAQSSCLGAYACYASASGKSAAIAGGKSVIQKDACIGQSACQTTAYDPTGSFSVEENSCKGPRACLDVGRAGIATVGTGSCIAEDPNDANVKQACSYAGRKGNFTVADRSCTGEKSCSAVGYEAGSTFKAGTDSCVSGADEMSCERAAYKGDVEIGDRSCNGKQTCRHLGYEGTVKVGDDSCLGFQACYQTGNRGGEVRIGDRSCQLPHSCRAMGQYAIDHEDITRERGMLEIGNDSCNCEGCCGCLQAGDKVPLGLCNSFGDGPTNCCTAEGDRNPFGPLKVSNLCLEEENKCLKATVSGDPHITTFSQTKYDCMGQGEFILAKSQSETDPLEIRGLFVDPEFVGEDDPWETNRSAQTTTRGVAFVVDEDIPMIRITTDQELDAPSCSLYFYVDGVGNVTVDTMLNDENLIDRNDVDVSGNDRWISFKFGDYDADIHVRVVKTQRWGCMMSLSACLKPKYHGDVLGLFGTNNPYKDDDWTTPDGTRLQLPSNPQHERGLATDFCLNNWCYEGSDGDPSNGSFFGDYLSKYYSRCDKSPYKKNHYDEAKVDELLQKIRANCDQADLFNIPDAVLYDAALANHIKDPEATACPIMDLLEAETNNAIAAFNCEVAPTPSPSMQPSEISDTRPTEISGDPHFRTWLGEHFEYHGQCDLVMMKDPSFADGLGLQIQIRTKLVRYWSYIRSVAILIGDEILEIEGYVDDDAGDELFYWYNLEEKGEMKTLGGFPVSFFRGSTHKQSFVIDLSSKYPGQSIGIFTFKEFVKVQYSNGSEESVGNTVGMMGDFKTGETLGRDGSVFDDFIEYGIEWQVRPEDQMLFHDVVHPQFPKSCVLPEDPQGMRRRRLDESSIKEADAEKACASLKDPLDRKDCVYDVLATQDIEMVGAF